MILFCTVIILKGKNYKLIWKNSKKVFNIPALLIKLNNGVTLSISIKIINKTFHFINNIKKFKNYLYLKIIKKINYDCKVILIYY